MKKEQVEILINTGEEIIDKTDFTESLEILIYLRGSGFDFSKIDKIEEEVASLLENFVSEVRENKEAWIDAFDQYFSMTDTLSIEPTKILDKYEFDTIAIIKNMDIPLFRALEVDATEIIMENFDDNFPNIDNIFREYYEENITFEEGSV